MIRHRTRRRRTGARRHLRWITTVASRRYGSHILLVISRHRHRGGVSRCRHRHACGGR